MLNSKPNVNLEQERFYFENSRKGRFTNIRFELDKVFDIGHYVPKTNHSDDREEANELSYSWFAWVDRAKLAQEEINKCKEKYGKLIGKIHALENKLGRYKSDDYVSVPRKPTEEMLRAFNEAFEIDYDDWYFDADLAYKGLIESVEKENGKTENS